MLIEIRLCNRKTYVFKGHVKIVKIYMVKFNVSILKRLNTLTATYKYSRSNTDNLPLPVQIQLSEKLKTFYKFFIAFFESALNFEH